MILVNDMQKSFEMNKQRLDLVFVTILSLSKEWFGSCIFMD